MRYLDKLLEGVEVEWKAFGEVAELKRGTTITAKDKIDGNIPVISGGQNPAYYNAKYNREDETITIAGSGAYAGHVLYWNEPIFVSDAFSVKPQVDLLNIKYVYHFLLNHQFWIYALQKGSGVPHVYPKDMAALRIPIPCPDNPKSTSAFPRIV
jgi:type I restriction enzyme, S subunit